MGTKKIKKADDYRITLTKKTKDTTYVFVNDAVALGSSLQFYSASDSRSYAKQGDDLVIINRFDDDKKGTHKFVLTTIKNYYNYYGTNDDVVLVNDNKPDLEDIQAYITKTADDKAEGINVVGDKGKTKYNLDKVSTTFTEGKEDHVEDLGGNDTYNIATDYSSGDKYSKVYIMDWAGKDKYNISRRVGGNYASYFSIDDKAGNDEYSVIDLNAPEKSEIVDEKGNDKYKIAYSNKMNVLDLKGKDKYAMDTVSDVSITDANGNDKYEIISSTGVASARVHIIDGDDGMVVGGNDSYNFNNITGLHIYDGAGNDKYNLAKVSNLGFNKDVYYVNDYYGNDKYGLKDSDNLIFDDHAGNDSWVLLDSHDLTVTDVKGKDSYTLSNVTTATITDKSGSDVYKTIGQTSADIKITDNDGNDTYGFTRSLNVNVNDTDGDDKYSFNQVTNGSGYYITDDDGDDKYIVVKSDLTIRDSEGRDSYNIKNSIHTTILDTSTESNDTYKVDNLKGVTIISDRGGKDSLTISSLNAKNVIYMADFQANGKGMNDGGLYLLDKTKTGYAFMGFYFKTKTVDGVKVYDTSESGNGRIETVKAGSKNITSAIDNFASVDNILELNATVSGWLTNNGFTSVNTLLTEGSDQQITDFITFVQG